MAEIKEFILERLKDLSNLPILDLGELSLEDFIFKSLMSNKFRKYSVNPEYQQHIHDAIHNCVVNNKPIKLAWGFGGYKLWRLKETPEVDWAELFSMIYFVNWIKPVLAVYEPGVNFEFLSNGCIIPLINNIPQSDIDRYEKTFNALLNFLTPFLSQNLKMTLATVIDLYKNEKELMAELDKKVSTNKRQHLTENQKASILLNVKSDHGKVYSDDELEQIQLIYDLYRQTSKRQLYYENPELIKVSSQPFENCLPIGTTKTSIVKFWIGVGAIGRYKDSFIEYVLSPRQAERENIKFIDIDIPGLNMQNFHSIRVLT